MRSTRGLAALAALAILAGAIPAHAADLPGARIEINGGSAAASLPTVAVGFHSLTGGAHEARLRWDASPTDADPWRRIDTLASPPTITIGVPPGAGEGGTCRSHTLYAQVRGPGGAQPTPATDSIVIDRDVEATVEPLWPADAAPGYTRADALAVRITDEDCVELLRADLAGVSYFAVAASGQYVDELSLPLPAAEGPLTLDLGLMDYLFNMRRFPIDLVRDTTPPALSLAGPAALRATGLGRATLELSGRFSDDHAPLPWGLALRLDPPPGGAAPASISRPLAAGEVRQIAAAAADGAPFSISAPIDLAALWPTAAPGSYELHLALLDRAGNPAPASIALPVRLPSRTHLPLVTR